MEQEKQEYTQNSPTATKFQSKFSLNSVVGPQAVRYSILLAFGRSALKLPSPLLKRARPSLRDRPLWSVSTYKSSCTMGNLAGKGTG